MVAATHRALGDMVQAGEFREDLLYRLNALTLRVPPLRERRDEIVLLANELLGEVGSEWCRAATRFSPEACAALEAYDWPGNVRELRNVIERALLTCQGTSIELSDLPFALPASGQCSRSEAEAGKATAPVQAPQSPRAFRERVREFEIDLIEQALARSEGNQRAASRDLRIPLRTLAHKIKAYGLRAATSEPSARESPSPVIVSRGPVSAESDGCIWARNPRLSARR